MSEQISRREFTNRLIKFMAMLALVGVPVAQGTANYRRSKIDFGSEDGSLHHHTILFSPDGSAYIRGHATTPIISDPDQDPSSKQHLEQVQLDLLNPQVAKNPNGAIEFVIVNSDRPKENGLIVYNMGIGGDIRNPVAVREMEVLTASNPDQQIMVINNAGSGQSSLPPSPVLAEMMKKGSFTPYGLWTFDLLQDKLGEYGDAPITIWGKSLGGRVAIGLAAACGVAGRPISNLWVIDPPWSSFPPDVTLDFLSQVPVAKNYYDQSPYNEARDDQVPDITTNNFQSTLSASGLLNLYNLVYLPRAMESQDGMAADLLAALGAVRGDFSILKPEYSEFGQPGPTEDLLAEAIKRASSQGWSLPDRVRVILLENQSHGVMSTGAGQRVWATLFSIFKQQ